MVRDSRRAAFLASLALLAGVWAASNAFAEGTVMPDLTLKAHGRAVLVGGDTMACKDLLKKLGGRWNPKAQGWIYPGSKQAEIKQALADAGCGVKDEVGDAPAAAAGGEAIAEPPAKRAKAPQEGADPSGSGDWHLSLGGNKRVTISSFSGAPSVDIREWYEDKADGVLKPGKKGLSLNADQWKALKQGLGDVDAALGKS